MLVLRLRAIERKQVLKFWREWIKCNFVCPSSLILVEKPQTQTNYKPKKYYQDPASSTSMVKRWLNEVRCGRRARQTPNDWLNGRKKVTTKLRNNILDILLAYRRLKMYKIVEAICILLGSVNECLALLDRNTDEIKRCSITDDETRTHHSTPKNKEQSSHWVSLEQLAVRKTEGGLSANKFIIHIDYLQTGRGIEGE